MVRIIRRPALTFQQWASSKGIELPPDHTLADVVGGVLQPNPTRASKGKWKAKARRLEAYYRAQAEYELAIKTGEIEIVEESVPLDMERAQDRAYARAMQKRAARRPNGNEMEAMPMTVSEAKNSDNPRVDDRSCLDCGRCLGCEDPRCSATVRFESSAVYCDACLPTQCEVR